MLDKIVTNNGNKAQAIILLQCNLAISLKMSFVLICDLIFAQPLCNQSLQGLNLYVIYNFFVIYSQSYNTYSLLERIGVGRFRILGVGGQGLEYWGGGGKFPAGT